MTFCYLASFEGGDASILASLGVSPTQQLAVDIDPESIDRFHAKYPEVPTHLGSIDKVKDRFDLIFVDLCANFSGTSLGLITRATQLARGDGTIFLYAVQRGRESRIATGLISRAAEKRAKGEHNQRIAGRVLDGRTINITQSIKGALHRRFLVPLSLGRINYQSVDPDEAAAGKPGTPMVIHAHVLSKAITDKRARDILERHETDLHLTVQAVRQFDGLGLPINESRPRAAAWLRRERTRPGSIGVSINGKYTDGGGPWFEGLCRILACDMPIFSDATGFGTRAVLASSVAWCESQNIDPTLALNLSGGEVAALKAHLTRGTYQAELNLLHSKQRHSKNAPKMGPETTWVKVMM